MTFKPKQRLSEEDFVSGILSGERVILSQAITLIESSLAEDNELGESVLKQVMPKTGNSLRLGITGVPGVGKSTFIETFGKFITNQGKRVAVLTIDPSSQKTGGSILGDKTRMEALSNDPLAYIRPSASGNSLGGVSAKTREAILLCEAAGFEVIIVETVGVGQSETLVHGMVDFFLLLMLAGAGDELQGIKKGIMEMADLLAINKADGDNISASKRARAEYQNALHLFPPSENAWSPKVMCCSALKQEGISDIWDTILEFQKKMTSSGYIENNRRKQNLDWMHHTIKIAVEQGFYAHVTDALRKIEDDVEKGTLTPMQGARELLDQYSKSKNSRDT